MVYVPAVQNWSIVSLDWSDAKWGPAGWAAAQPMTTEEVLYADAKRIVSASRGKSFVYRNTCKALPWFTSVRRLLDDASYRPWFLPYAAVPPIQGVGYYSPPCDAYTGKCSTLYHDSTQSPECVAAARGAARGALAGGGPGRARSTLHPLSLGTPPPSPATRACPSAP